MSPRLALVGALLAVGALSGQTADTSGLAPWSLPPDHFPVWSHPAETEPLMAADTLGPALPGLDFPPRQRFKPARWLGAGATAVLGVLAYRTYRQADAAYLAYQRSGNPTELESLFAETERLDRLAGWYYAGAEAGLVLVAVSIVLGR